MSRVSSKSNSNDRAPRRRVEKRVRKTAVTAKKEEKREEKREELNSDNKTRKAPAVFSEEKKERKKISKRVFLMSLAVVACLVLAVFVGNSDEGQIDTAAKIAENAKRAANSVVEFDEFGNEVARDEVVPPPVVSAAKLSPRGVGTAKVENLKPTLEESELLATSSDEEKLEDEEEDEINEDESGDEEKEEGENVEEGENEVEESEEN